MVEALLIEVHLEVLKREQFPSSSLESLYTIADQMLWQSVARIPELGQSLILITVSEASR